MRVSGNGWKGGRLPGCDRREDNEGAARRTAAFRWKSRGGNSTGDRNVRVRDLGRIHVESGRDRRKGELEDGSVSGRARRSLGRLPPSAKQKNERMREKASIRISPGCSGVSRSLSLSPLLRLPLRVCLASPLLFLCLPPPPSPLPFRALPSPHRFPSNQASLKALRDAHVTAVRERADPFPPAAAEVARSLAHLSSLLAPSRSGRLAGSPAGASLERDAATRARVCSTAVERLQQCVDATAKRCEEARKKTRGGAGPRWWAEGLLAGTGFSADVATGEWRWDGSAPLAAGGVRGRWGRKLWGTPATRSAAGGAKEGSDASSSSLSSHRFPPFPLSAADLLTAERRLASEAASAPSPAEVAHRQGAVLALSEALAAATSALDAFRAEGERARRVAQEAARRRRPKPAGARRRALAPGGGVGGVAGGGGSGGPGGGSDVGVHGDAADADAFQRGGDRPVSVLSSRRGGVVATTPRAGRGLHPGEAAFASAVAPEGSGLDASSGGGAGTFGGDARGAERERRPAAKKGGAPSGRADGTGRRGGGGGGPADDGAVEPHHRAEQEKHRHQKHQHQQQQLQAFLAAPQSAAAASALRQQAAQAAQAAHEISQLNAVFSAAVARQSAQIATLYDEAVAATGHVSKATEQLQKADDTGTRGKLTTFYFLLLCTAIVLFAHWADG